MLYAILNVGDNAAVALDHGRLDIVLRFQFFGELLGGTFVVGIVDRDVAAFCREFPRDFSAQTSDVC